MAFAKPDVIQTPITNKAYGYPFKGNKRRKKPTILAIVHIAGNVNTAKMTPPRKGTRAEIAYMNRKGSTGPSAHTYISRDGAIFQCFSPAFAGWSNGDLLSPDTSKPYVREMVKNSPRYNPNELVYREYELTGHPSSKPVTKKQMESLAYQIARDSIKSGIPIKPLVTVGIHAHINTINRRNDPWSSNRVAKIKALCKRAQAWKDHLKGKPDPDDKPKPKPTPVPPSEAPDLQDQIDTLKGQVNSLKETNSGMEDTLALVGEAVDPYFDFEEED